MTNKQFDDIETVILLDFCLFIERNELALNRYIVYLSIVLRRLALIRGYNVGLNYRNEAGLKYQAAMMLRYVNNEENPNRKTPKLFKDIADFKCSDINGYSNKLWEALTMANSEEVKQSFLEYLTKKRPDAASAIYWAFEIIEDYIKTHRFPYSSLYDDLTTETVNRIQKALTNDRSFMYNNRKIQRDILLGFTLLKEYIVANGNKRSSTQPAHTIENKTEKSEVYSPSSQGGDAFYSASHVENISENKQAPQELEDDLYNRIDFENIVELSYTRPVELKYNDLIIDNATNWTSLYTGFMEHILTIFPEYFRSGQIIGFGSRTDIGDNYKIPYMVTPKRISEHYYLETNYSARDICKKIGAVIKLCGISFDEVVLTFERKNSSTNVQQRKAYKKVEAPINQLSLDEISPQSSNKLTFEQWLVDKKIVSDEHANKLAQYLQICDLYLKNERISSTPLKDISTYKELLNVQALLTEDNRFKMISKRKHNYPLFVLDKYIEYREELIISDCTAIALGTAPDNSQPDDKKERINDILRKQFEDGYRLGNYMHKIRFISSYNSEYGEELSGDNIDDIIKRYGRTVDDRVFANDDENNIIDKICKDIIQTFDDGASVMYWECIYNKYNKDLNNNNIYSSDALRRLLLHEKKLHFNVNNKMLYVNLETHYEIRKLVVGSYAPIQIEEIQEKLWYIPLDTIKSYLRKLDRVVLTDNAYFYAPNFQISTEESLALVEAMHKAIAEKGSIVKNDILDIMQENCPFAYIEAQKFKDYAIRNIIGILYSDLFGVSRSAITEKGTTIQYGEMFEQFASERESFSLYELKDFKKSRNAPTIYWDKLYQYAVRVSEDEFVKRNNITFDVDKIDDVLDTMCAADYTPIKDIILYLAFPNVGYIWNNFLLESYVRQYSRKFRLIQLTPNLTNTPGAIVRQGSDYATYDDVIADYLAKNPTLWSDERSAIECIVNAGFQNNNTYNNISQVIKRANKIIEDEG